MSNNGVKAHHNYPEPTVFVLSDQQSNIQTVHVWYHHLSRVIWSQTEPPRARQFTPRALTCVSGDLVPAPNANIHLRHWNKRFSHKDGDIFMCEFLRAQPFSTNFKSIPIASKTRLIISLKMLVVGTAWRFLLLFHIEMGIFEKTQIWVDKLCVCEC